MYVCVYAYMKQQAERKTSHAILEITAQLLLNYLVQDVCAPFDKDVPKL